MDTKSSNLRLQVPIPEQTRLSFCKPTVRDLTAWIQNLPKANIGETARLLYQALLELNNFKTTPETRVQLLELLRPEVLFINSQLEKHFLNNSVMLDERPQKVANLCQALQKHLTTGYKLVIAGTQHQRTPILALALQRTLHSMFVSLVRTYQLYFAAPPLFWFELHQVYWLARKQSLHALAIRDPMLINVRKQSVEAAYSCALLLSCSRINQMRQSDIAVLALALPSWTHLSTLQNASLETSLFVVDLNSDAPPRYKELIEQDTVQTRIGLNTLALAQALIEYQQPNASSIQKKTIEVPQGMSSTLLAQLCSAWGNIAKRDFQRINSKGILQACIGMSAVHYYLSGQESFESTLKSQQTACAPYQVDSGSADVWGDVNGEHNRHEHNPLSVDLLEYTDTRDEDGSTQTAGALYPSYALAIVNHSPGGYCLAWHTAIPAQLQAGEIIALREDDDKPWVTAVIRWIRQTGNDHTQMGVELIAPNALPCGLRLLRSSEKSSHFLRALLVPQVQALSRPASVIAPRIPFQEGNKVAINQQGTELTATLTKRSMHTGSISQFEYSILSAPLQPDPAQHSTEEHAAHKTENFDALWKSL